MDVIGICPINLPLVIKGHKIYRFYACQNRRNSGTIYAEVIRMEALGVLLFCMAAVLLVCTVIQGK